MSNSILIKTVRVNGFRGLENFEVPLEPTTVLTGMNNVGKTSFLKALQIALGSRQFISQDDFFIKDDVPSNKIIIDLLIVPINSTNEIDSVFSDDWESLLTTDRIKFDEDTNSIVPLRTIVKYDPIRGGFTTKQYILDEWKAFAIDVAGVDTYWHESDNGQEKSFKFDEMPFFYMDAQRDILEDIKLKKSYLGKMISQIKYSPEAILEIEEKIKELNESAVQDSEILTTLKTTLEELDSAMGSNSEHIEITPFTKKIRDLNKGLTIYYGDSHMEYHGMGTRSWSSLLTLKSFIELLKINAIAEDTPFFPIVAIEEPEAHLHPNAQKKLYSQINTIVGQKIISTHSPYIAATAKIEEVRNFYKNDTVECGQINIGELAAEDIRKINRQVINTRGEIFFSKCLVLFEGETEEQALPIFFDKYFGKTSVELGVDFVGVGGYGNYLPFIRFAEYLKIPWIILSDNDQNGTVKTSVKKQFVDSGTTKIENDSIIFLDTDCDFERQLINDGYIEDIKEVLISLRTYSNPQHEAAQKPNDIIEITAYQNEEVYDVITKAKTKFAPVISTYLVENDKDIPSKVINLFEKVNTILNLEEPE
ncbi:MAG: AAA family ATPase [Campylobacterota bacterium]|nr:AAA family ATPase [Campylobacterota bacterium]